MATTTSDDGLAPGAPGWVLPGRARQRAALRALLRTPAGCRVAYREDPVGFVAHCFAWPGGQCPTPYQEETLRLLAAEHRVAMVGPHGEGKTAVAAWALLWFALTREGATDWKVVTTASAWRQLTHYLWPEIRKWVRRLDWPALGRPPFLEARELQQLSLQLRTGEAFAVASDNPALIEGAHATELLYVFDEAKTIPGDTFDAAEGAFASAGADTGSRAYALALSTPGEPQGRFYEICARQPGYEDWRVRRVRLAECVAAGRVSEEWAAQRARQWGESSAVYRNRVLGEFAASDEEGVIPLSWVEAAIERWHQWVAAERPGQLSAVGVDVARSGEDRTVIARLVAGPVVASLTRSRREDTMQTTGRVVGALQANRRAPAVVDVIGIGAGVVDRLREQGYQVLAFNAAEGTDLRDRTGELGFANKRSAAWWHLREALDPTYEARLALPPDDSLAGDLTAPHWRVTSSGRIQVESKDDIRKRLGRSTDDGDAVMQAVWSGAEAEAGSIEPLDPALAELLRNYRGV